MSQTDAVLEASRVLVALGLAVFVGGPLAGLIGRKKKIFLEGEEGEGIARARFVAAGLLLLGVLLEVQVLGSSLPPRHVWRAVLLFILVASLVTVVMVVRPRERYYREKTLSLEEDLRQPWMSRADAAQRRGDRIDWLGFLLALAALVLG